MILDAIKDAWSAAKDRLGLSNDSGPDYYREELATRKAGIQPASEKAMDRPDRADQWRESDQAIARDAEPDMHVRYLTPDQRANFAASRGINEMESRLANNPISNPTIDRDNNQPRLKL